MLPSGTKSLSLSNELHHGPALIVFIDAKPLTSINYHYTVVSINLYHQNAEVHYWHCQHMHLLASLANELIAMSVVVPLILVVSIQILKKLKGSWKVIGCHSMIIIP